MMRSPNEAAESKLGSTPRRKYTRRIKQRVGRPTKSLSGKYSGPTAVILRNKMTGFIEYNAFDTVSEALSAVEGAKKLLSGPNYHYVVLPTDL